MKGIIDMSRVDFSKHTLGRASTPDDLADLDPSIDDQGFGQPIVFDGLDSALIGFASQWSGPTLAVYDEEKVLAILQKDMDESDAIEFYEYNIKCMYAGPSTPIILTVRDGYEYSLEHQNKQGDGHV